LSRRFLYISTLWRSRHFQCSPYSLNKKNIVHNLKVPNLLPHTPVCQLHMSCPAHSASQDETASNDDKTKVEPPQSTSTKPRKIEKMPPALTKMLLAGNNTTKSESWPEFGTVCSLARKCGHGGVTVQEVEMYLLKNYRGETKEEDMGEPNFYSLHLLASWENGEKVLEKTLDYFETILQSGKTGLPVKRLEYCMAIWRLSIIVQDCFSKNLLEDILLLEKISHEMEEKYNDNSLSLLIFLAGVGQNRNIGPLKDPFFVKISDIIKEIAKESIKTKSHKMPSLLLFENTEEIIHKILEKDQDPHHQIELQSYLSRVQWSNRSFSKSLDTLVVATNSFPSAVDDNVEDGARVGVALLEAWHSLTVSALKLNMTPAIEYMLTLAEMTAKKGGNGVGSLPAYVFWLTAHESESTSGSQVASDLLEKVPNIDKLGEVDKARDSKFKRVFIAESMNNETKTFFVGDFIKCLVQKKVPTAKDAIKDESSIHEIVDDKSDVSTPNVLENTSQSAMELDNGDSLVNIDEQLLTIKIIESIAKGNIAEAVDTVLKEVREELHLVEAVSALVSALSKSGDLYNLDLLAQKLPSSHPAVDAVYASVVNVRLKGVMERWQNGEHKDAWDSLVTLYSGVIQDSSSGRVLHDTGEIAADRCRRYGKIFIEETVGKEHEEMLKYIREKVLDIHNKHGDVALMAAYWEACFFSSRFNEKELANDLLNEFPALVGNIVKIDTVLDRAERYGLESLHRRLLEVCLTHNLSPYCKSRAFEGLLRLQTRKGQISAAEQTINTAKSLDIKISSDYKNDLIQLKFMAKDEEKEQNHGILESIRNLFYKKK